MAGRCEGGDQPTRRRVLAEEELRLLVPPGKMQTSLMGFDSLEECLRSKLWVGHEEDEAGP